MSYPPRASPSADRARDCAWSGPLLWALLVGIPLILGLEARFDPRLPFLFASWHLEWWVDGEPLSTLADHGPHRLTFRFRPPRAGRLEVAAMSRFTLRDGETVLLLGPRRPGDWKEVSATDVPPRSLLLEAEDERWLPAIGLGGEAAPAAVEVLHEALARPARRARSFFSIVPALPPPLPAAAFALIALGGLALLWLLARPPLVGVAPALFRGRPRWLALVLVLHVALAAGNVARYPAVRGLDADAHLEFARRILAERGIPDLAAGFQTYHPPLYHALGALALDATGSERSLQVLSALAGIALVLVVARRLGARGVRGLVLLAFAPVLLVAEPQATNEVLLAALATGALAVATAPAAGPGSALIAGALGGLALLTKYTGVLVLIALALALLLPRPGQAGETGSRRALRAAAGMAIALAIGAWPYVQRWRLYGDPFVGNWDDVLGHPYRQPPGFRMAAYFLRFGAAFVAHPFRAREVSLWDSLYVSLAGDGFGRFISEPGQHYLLFLLAWAALPLLLITLAGFAAALFRPRAAGPLEVAGLAFTLVLLGATVRYNLELPYWSVGKGVFLLSLALPVAAAFERGRSAVVARAGGKGSLMIDAALAVYALLSIAAFTYR